MLEYTKDGTKYRARVVMDECSFNPREEYDGYITTMAFYHPRYALGDICTKSSDDVRNVLYELAGKDPDDDMSFGELVDYIRENIKDVYLKVVYFYDHGGITIGTKIAWPDHQWDGGTLGVIYVKKKDVIEQIGGDDNDWKEIADQIIEGDIEEYDNFINGNIYAIILEKCKKYANVDDPNDTIEEYEEIDSCCGYISNNYGKALDLELMEAAFGLPEKFTYVETNIY